MTQCQPQLKVTLHLWMFEVAVSKVEVDPTNTCGKVKCFKVKNPKNVISDASSSEIFSFHAEAQYTRNP